MASPKEVAPGDMPGDIARGWLDRFAAMTPPEIAAFMHGQAIVGSPRNAFSCAIARFLADETGCGVSVFGVITLIDDRDPQGCPRVWTLERPESVNEFIHQFDKLQYPQLLNLHYRRMLVLSGATQGNVALAAP